jgi:hypothetical protein
MKEFNVLKKKTEEVVALITSLKQERAKFLENIEKQKEHIKFMEEENKVANKIIAQTERLEKERKEVRERLQILLDRLEKTKV